MSKQTLKANKLIEGILKEAGIGAEHFGGDQFGGKIPWQLLGNVVKTGVKATGQFVKNNPEMAVSALEAGASAASSFRQGGQEVSDASQMMMKQGGLGSKGKKVAQIMNYIGQYRMQIGTMQQQLVAQGIITEEAQAEMIRNALVEELYTTTFMNQDQKATLSYIINRIDQKLFQVANQ